MLPRLRLTAIALVIVVAGCVIAPPDESASAACRSRADLCRANAPRPHPRRRRCPTVDVPLVVVTGYTNALASVTKAEMDAMILAGDALIQACEFFTAANPVPRCLPAAEIVAHVEANPTEVALVPAGLVVPTIKVVPVDGADPLRWPGGAGSAVPVLHPDRPDAGAGRVGARSVQRSERS